jgi:hypothetical protein
VRLSLDEKRSALGSVVIVLLTLVVFQLAQGQGPDSYVRRFHSAIYLDKSFDNMFLSSDSPEIVEEIAYDSQVLLQLSRKFEVDVLAKQGRTADVVVTYSTHSLGTVIKVFRVEKEAGTWKINARGTKRLSDQMLGSRMRLNQAQ